MSSKQTIGLYTASLSGHRSSYLIFLSTLFPSKRVYKKKVLFRKDPVLFMMVEESFCFYFCASILRALMGRRTVGLLFRPKPVLEGKGLKLILKKYSLYVLKIIGNVRTLTIVPFYLNPKFNTIADGWIYDFQLWDLSQSDLKAFKKYQTGEDNNTFGEEVSRERKGLPVLVAIGRQDLAKGFDLFVDSAISNNKNVQFIFGGKVAESEKSLISPFIHTGGIASDRFISDDEVLQLYAIGSAAWCVYSSEYDQASGILGRAVQLGVPVIVREHSLMHEFCKREDCTFILYKQKVLEQVNFDILKHSTLDRSSLLIKKFSSFSVDQLNSELGL